MGHFAKINKKNIVVTVIAAKQNFIDNAFPNQTWIKTSYNTKGGIHYEPNSNIPSEDQSKALRKNYAGVGCVYDPERDAFYEPQPFKSWTLNEETCQWEAPKPYPQDGKLYKWNESKKSWVVI
tara:strand:- start:1433 stop:1801 length:369 start_codon:yes stop_codon:yes gene_type:complete